MCLFLDVIKRVGLGLFSVQVCSIQISGEIDLKERFGCKKFVEQNVWNICD